MKQFGFLCIFIALSSVGFGAYLMAASLIDFMPELFTVCKLAVGIVWVMCGVAILTASVSLFVTGRKKSRDKRKNYDDER